ncbi:uncharacterized protein LOC143265035 isoform X2 [Megachile rotundata]|uniref:uncharacterized protein LOC143265035 isoform X2 n=1 Tax=Megachile rotundata TaxID=143995 RepID=UPI003FD3C49E
MTEKETGKKERRKKSLVIYVDVDAIEEFLLRDGGRKLRCPIRNRGKPQKERPRDSEETTRKKERVKERGRENQKEMFFDGYRMTANKKYLPEKCLLDRRWRSSQHKYTNLL